MKQTKKTIILISIMVLCILAVCGGIFAAKRYTKIKLSKVKVEDLFYEKTEYTILEQTIKSEERAIVLVDVECPDFSEFDLDSMMNAPENEWELMLKKMLLSKDCPIGQENMSIPVHIKEGNLETEEIEREILARKLIELINRIEVK